ncbi:MAG: hypothetical protein V1867_03270 [Candidatus Falkowbacteria bacterium]
MIGAIKAVMAKKRITLTRKTGPDIITKILLVIGAINAVISKAVIRVAKIIAIKMITEEMAGISKIKTSTSNGRTGKTNVKTGVNYDKTGKSSAKPGASNGRTGRCEMAITAGITMDAAKTIITIKNITKTGNHFIHRSLSQQPFI